MVGYKIYFYPKSFEKAMRQIDKAKIDLLAKCELFMRRLGEIGQITAQTAFNSRSITVTSELIKDNDNIVVQVKANGKGVCFLEFGAGTATDINHPFRDNVPFNVIPGSYSETHRQWFFLYGKWWFGGREYTFVEPRRGMYKAYKEITQRVYEIADEVFNG